MDAGHLTRPESLFPLPDAWELAEHERALSYTREPFPRQESVKRSVKI